MNYSKIENIKTIDKIHLYINMDYDMRLEIIDTVSRDVLFEINLPNGGNGTYIDIPVNIRLRGDAEIFFSGSNWCLNAGTKILMADGSEKKY